MWAKSPALPIHSGSSRSRCWPHGFLCRPVVKSWAPRWPGQQIGGGSSQGPQEVQPTAWRLLAPGPATPILTLFDFQLFLPCPGLSLSCSKYHSGTGRPAAFIIIVATDNSQPTFISCLQSACTRSHSVLTRIWTILPLTEVVLSSPPRWGN